MKKMNREKFYLSDMFFIVLIMWPILLASSSAVCSGTMCIK